MSRRTQSSLIVAVLVVLGCVVVAVVARAKASANSMVGLLLDRGGLLPTSNLMNDLRSGDVDRQREALGLLHRRRDPSAISLALPLLASRDDYVWLNAALYLGAVGRPETVPYLVKALRHGAFHADLDTIGYLETLTGQHLGSDFQAWRAWYRAQPNAIELDWTSHLGYGARASPLRDPPPASDPTSRSVATSTPTVMTR